jgi:XTP/dITP diphosphohydrolase|tara:strand:+ start:1253 stop:1852 length:600 start_codon:yes stop_codon:yes gene_type:complete
MKKIKKILIGTHNKGKFKELSDLLPKRIKKLSLLKFGIKSPKETGKTFSANSKLKAEYFSKRTKNIVISDDSGLMVECLDQKPGIYSARWGKKYGGFHKAMNRIIKMVKIKNINKNKKNTRATFVCALSIKFPNGKLVSSVGKMKGSISSKIKGNKGFGYDSIFIPNKYKITFGEMSSKKKSLIDHRFIAFKKLKKKLI